MTQALTVIRHAALALAVCLGAAGAASAQLSVGLSMPGVDIGIHLREYPQLVRVPNYPVYYAPQLASNFFFYDGLYWVYEQDDWYASDWYDGPWGRVEPQAVPYFVLRIPVRYYRRPPVYFQGWRPEAPPRWDDHWGPGWSQQHRGWDRWDRRAMPNAAPLPAYQRQYAGDRYPPAEQQREIRSRNYRYQPREDVVRPHGPQPSVAPLREAPQRRAPQVAPAPAQRPTAQERPQRPPPEAAPRPVPSPPQGRGGNRPDRADTAGPAREAGRDRGRDGARDNGRDGGNERGRGPDRGNGDDRGPSPRK